MNIEYLINNSKLFHDIYFTRYISKLKRRNHQLVKSAVPSEDYIYNYEKLKEHVIARKNPKDTVCHIIGSGWSLNKSKAKIKGGDFVIGFNQAAISGLKFDLYFTEFGGYKVQDISMKQIALIEDIVKPHTDLVFFKNIYDDKNDVDFIQKHWGEKIYYIPDIQIPVYHEKYLIHTLQFFLQMDNTFLKQYCSTTLSTITLAKNCGFKNVVLHGVDFGGAYFFDVPGFDNLIDYRPSEKNVISYSKSNSKDVHITADSKFGMKVSLPILNGLCLQDGLKLWSASEESPLSKMLPVYNHEPVP